MRATRHTIAVVLRPPHAEVVDFRTYITVPQAAKVLGLSCERTYRLIHTNQLHAVETPLGYLVSRASAAALRRTRERTPKNQPAARATSPAAVEATDEATYAHTQDDSV